eukprot:TRINITY_DN26473_c0_g1_i1.p1 TRINITY_DN26473_c0_g1~~TRINITY_DN26473_c0_g1_i1.p1  ORF type:complete len:217 (-),score=30.54 TRINITY_DN26473_c0_g1_i1:25-675(-)
MMRSIKLVAVGDGATGKTSLLLTYSANSFPVDYIPTVFDNYATNLMVGGSAIALNLWDTAGQEDYDRLRPLSYPQTDVFIVCFSVVTPSTLHNVAAKWLPELAHYCPAAPVLIVGTKADLRSDPRIIANSDAFAAKDRTKQQHELAGRNRAVTQEEIDGVVAQARKDGFNIIDYVECSALLSKNLDKVFSTAVNAAIEPFQGKGKKKHKKVRCSIM